jgi:hypothetical protein
MGLDLPDLLYLADRLHLMGGPADWMSIRHVLAKNGEVPEGYVDWSDAEQLHHLLRHPHRDVVHLLRGAHPAPIAGHALAAQEQPQHHLGEAVYLLKFIFGTFALHEEQSCYQVDAGYHKSDSRCSRGLYRMS